MVASPPFVSTEMIRMIDDEDALLESLEAMEKEQYVTEHYRPLEDAADEFIRWAETPELRVYTGLPSLDQAMRGTAPGEVTIIQGFTHSGKTLLVTEILQNNHENIGVVFTPDETRPLVLTKLAAAEYGVDIRELEKRIREDDATARQVLLDTAAKYKNLAVFDESVTLHDMSKMMDEFRAVTGQVIKFVVFDYVNLLEGHDDVKAKMTALKAWGKRQQVALFLLHQASRTSGGGGKKMTIESGEYGGEQQATHVIGVRRKKYQHYAMLNALQEKIDNASNPTSISMYEAKMKDIRDILIPRDENTITISLVKNKRPPCLLVDDEDYMIEPDTGKLKRIKSWEQPDGGVVRTTKAQLRSVTPKPWEEREMF